MRKGRIVLVDGSLAFTKGRPKNYLAAEAVGDLARKFIDGEPTIGAVAQITLEDAKQADYNLNPSKWIERPDAEALVSIPDQLHELAQLDSDYREVSTALATIFGGVQA